MLSSWETEKANLGKQEPSTKMFTYGDANADALTLASAKLKDTFNENTEWFGFEEHEDTKEE